MATGPIHGVSAKNMRGILVFLLTWHSPLCMMGDMTTSLSAREATTYWVCEDCYLTHHGYSREELPHRLDREPLALVPAGAVVTAGLVRGEHGCTGTEEWECDCEHDTFSWSPCDGCGTRIGGTRDALTVWAVSA